MTGRLIAVVGPSGVGKDTVMDALCVSNPCLLRVKRVITRAADAGGEDYYAVDTDRFNRMRDGGEFALHWPAHGLLYGIPHAVKLDLAAGRDAIVNLSRAMLEQALAAFPTLEVLLLTASPETRAIRLAGRGRETPDEIVKRLTREVAPLPAHLRVTEVSNEDPLNQVVARINAIYFPARARRCNA